MAVGGRSHPQLNFRFISGVVGTRSVTVQKSTLVPRTSESPVYL